MGCFCEDSGENWPRYNGTAWYMMTSWHRKDVPYFWLFGVDNPLLTCGFLLQKSVMRSFDIFFVVSLNELSNNSRSAVIFEAMTLMWLHCDDFLRITTVYQKIWCRYRYPDAIQVHFGDVKMSAMASQITSLTIVYSTVYSGADQRKHQSSASLAFLRGIHRWPVNSPHKGPVARKMFPFDDVIMIRVQVHEQPPCCHVHVNS